MPRQATAACARVAGSLENRTSGLRARFWEVTCSVTCELGVGAGFGYEEPLIDDTRSLFGLPQELPKITRL